MKQSPLPPFPVPPVASARPVAAPAPVTPPPAPPAPPQPSPMARQPVAKTQRVVPSAPTPRGVVRTDTHNAANQVPAHAKHKGRGM